MHLYIGNATRQIVDFAYRMKIPGQSTTSLRSQTIRIGGQTKITGDLSAEDIDFIIGQHAKYGLVAADEVDRTKPFIGMCYSVDKPISADKLNRAMRHNVEVLVAQGREIRKEAAIAENNRLEQSLVEQGRPEGLRELDISVAEETRKDTSPTFNEVIQVRRGHEGEAPRRNKTRRAA